MDSLELVIKNLPDKSGVYQYFDKDGKLLYIGKAKSLKNRVKNYFRLNPFRPSPDLPPRIAKMISETEFMSYIVLDSEHDALILENSLIKQLKPKYNILLRDDKTFPYIFIDENEEYPRLEITRKVIQGRGVKYFGPFSSGARDILDSIYEIFPLVQKRSCLRSKKVCLFYQIKKCVGACERKITPNDYKEILKEAISYIQNREKLLNKLKEKMEFYANNLRFEEAAILRDRCQRIEKIETISSVDLATLENLDVFVVYAEGLRAVILKMFMRNGKIVSSSHKILRILDSFDIAEAYKRVILDYYQTKLPLMPSKIIVANEVEDKEIVQEHVSSIAGKKVEIVIPKVGEKKRLINLAIANAKELLRLETNTTQNKVLDMLLELINFNGVCQRIEIFDTSHIAGSIPVGAMVVYEDNNFKKDEYRHYNLSTTDEYSQIRELLNRRIESFSKSPPPDLWIIDGGIAQLNIAFEVISSSGANLEAIAISKEKVDAKAYRSKGAAKDIIYAKNGTFRLEPSDKRLQFIQFLRDEAHRFALSFHRKQKIVRDKEIGLLKIKGISEAKIKRLLNYFGTFEAIREATYDELIEVVSKKDAEAILNSR